MKKNNKKVDLKNMVWRVKTLPKYKVKEGPLEYI